MKILVRGCGWVTPAGSGRGPLPAGAFAVAGQPRISDSSLVGWSGGSRFGRLDLFSRVGVAAVALALQDAGLGTGESGAGLRDIGLIVATVSGSQRTDQEFFQSMTATPGLGSPALFVYTLATSFVGEAALRFGLSGTTLALNEKEISGLDALKVAFEQLPHGDDVALLVGINNLFPAEKSLLSLGQGACFVVLEKESLSEPQSAYGELVSDNRLESLCFNGVPCSGILGLGEMLTEID